MKASEFLQIYTDHDGEPDYEVVEEGDWINEGKYQSAEIVYKVGDQFFCVVLSRSGSYFSDYDYLEPDCYEVEPVVITKTEYRVKQA